jgi:DNA-binding IclR family transcriptional regulator
MESTSLTKALCLLEATAGHPEGRSLADLAAEAGLPKPTAHRLLQALARLGYLDRPRAGVYRQTTSAKRLVSDHESRQLLESAGTALRDLHARTQETVNLGILRQDRVLYLEVIESTQALRRVANRASDPFHTTALGRAIAAFLPAPYQERLLARAKLERRTPATIASARPLKAELAKVRRQGFAIEADETDLGVTCVAAPIFAAGEVSGAMSVSVPSARAVGPYRSRLVKLVQDAARHASKRLTRGRRAQA